MASAGLVKLLRTSGMERKVCDWMDDVGYFQQADEYAGNGDFYSARRELENGLLNAVNAVGGDYDFNFRKIKYAVGNIIGF